MSTVAQKFLEELQKGDQTQAIETIKESLRENAYKQIEETRQEILESYGFVLAEGIDNHISKAKKIVQKHLGNKASRMDFLEDSSYEFTISASDPEQYNPNESDVLKIAKEIRSTLKGARVNVHETDHTDNTTVFTISVADTSLMSESMKESSIKVGDKVEIGHQDPNTSEVSFKGDTSVGEVVEIKGNRVLVADSDGDTDWSDMKDVRKVGR